jgi:hypothetical protein
MINKKEIINQSQFFKFKQAENPLVQIHKGWNKSIIAKFTLKKDDEINEIFFKKNFSFIINKEKILVVTSGKIEIKKNEKVLVLKEFDALNFSSDNKDFKVRGVTECNFYLVSSTAIPSRKIDGIYFNFKNDIVSRDIWGGQCISRPYVGIDLNLVLFDLKPGFKFEDQGHANEQITWVIQGSMDFYSNDLKMKLTPANGVDIGPHHLHGGISNGAIGFDAFFPKREESQYKQVIKTKKFE